MSAESTVMQGRALAESLMTDQWELYVLDMENVDPLTGDAQRSVVYRGKARLQSWEGYEQTPESAGHTSTVQRMSLHLPITSYRPQVGHVAQCLESFDPNLVGTEYRISQDAPFKSYGTAYRVFVDFKAA